MITSKEPLITEQDMNKLINHCKQCLSIQHKTPEDTRNLIDSITILILVTTGIRGIELISLPIEAFNLELNRIFIKAAKKGNSRWLPLILPEAVTLEIKRMKELGIKTFGSFYSDSISKQLQTTNMQRRIKLFITHALSKEHRYTICSFRHTFAIKMLKAMDGRSDALPMLQQRLGHKNISSTGVYLSSLKMNECDDIVIDTFNFIRK